MNAHQPTVKELEEQLRRAEMLLARCEGQLSVYAHDSGYQPTKQLYAEIRSYWKDTRR